MIDVTQAAAREMGRLITTTDKPAGTLLRLSVQGGGCAGLTYKLDLTSEALPGDRSFDLGEGVRLVVDPKSYLFLNGVTVDFKESLMGRGFVFENPNAKGGCGCGTSFSV